jgi:hypothetical protein
MFCFERLDAALATQLLKSIVAEQGDLKQPAHGNHQLAFDPDNLALAAECIPLELREAAGRLRARLSDEALSVAWLKICSAYGFLTPPELLADGDIRLDDRLSLRAGDAVLCKELPHGRAAVAANGHAVFTKCLGVKAMMRLLESTGSVSVRSLLETLAGSEGTSNVSCGQDGLNLLRHLVRSRALNRD